MKKNKLLIPIILVIITIFLAVLTTHKPSEVSTDIVVQAPTQELSTLPQETSTAEISKTFIPPENTAEPTNEITDLGQIKQILMDKITNHFMTPGWLEVEETLSNFTNREETIVVPENQQIIPKNWVQTTWLYINEKRQISAGYSSRNTGDGTVVSTSIYSDGTKFEALNQKAPFQMDVIMKLDYLDRILSTGGTGDVTWKEINGRRVVGISSSDHFPEPMLTDGVEQPVTAVSGTNYYDWETGQFLYSEDWLTFVDGSIMQANHLEMQVRQILTPLAEVLGKFKP